ncbi:MAG: hypothetical protein VX519_11625 [Myxococcota bacterium]|nr:hypothetical protein [Myxococcota bacterium]
MARPVMLGAWVLFSTQVWAAGGPIVVHRAIDSEQLEIREGLDSMLVERGYAKSQWVTSAELAGSFEVYPLWTQIDVACEEQVELRVWLERLDRMEMRVQILDLDTAQELGVRLQQERVCLQEVPARRDLQRLAVTTGRAQWLRLQTAPTEQQALEAREAMEGLGRLGHDLVLPPGLEPELQKLIPRVGDRAESIVMGAGPQGRLAVDGQRIASGVLRRQSGKHLIQVEDANGGRVLSAQVLDLQPGRVFLWAGELEDGALEGELEAALVGTTIEPGLLKAIANGLGSPLFFFSYQDDVATLRRHDGSVALVLAKGGRASMATSDELRSEKWVLGLGPSIGGSVTNSMALESPQGMGGVTGWVGRTIQPGMMLVGSVGYQARQDPLPARREATWLTSWEVPVRVGLRFLPRNAVWETGLEGELRWESGIDAGVQAGGRFGFRAHGFSRYGGGALTYRSACRCWPGLAGTWAADRCGNPLVVREPGWVQAGLLAIAR